MKKIKKMKGMKNLNKLKYSKPNKNIISKIEDIEDFESFKCVDFSRNKIPEINPLPELIKKLKKKNKNFISSYFWE